MSRTVNVKLRPFNRSGLHRLECERCDHYVYGTVAALEAHGLPRCGCGGEFQPARLEVAVILGVLDCPAVSEYEREVNRVSHGQSGYGRSLRGQAAELRSPEQVAAERIERDRRERARASRIGALSRPVESIPF